MVAPTQPGLDEFLKPVYIDAGLVLELSREFSSTFAQLAAESLDQFLPTPISESILRPSGRREDGLFLAIDIGGTNLRVGFVELLAESVAASNGENGEGRSHVTNGVHVATASVTPRLRRLIERSWPIQDHLKYQNAESLFRWIGVCIADVIRQACESLGLSRRDTLPMGVTFSFPMEQVTLSEAKLMAMGKGFAITSKLDLGSQLLKGYNNARGIDLPGIQIAAIANDSVATLVSFIYEFQAARNQKAVMGLICGTGSNATIPLRLSSLHPSKRPRQVHVLPGQEGGDVKIAVNTEWSINGSAPPLRKLGLISRWDDELSETVECPGFQPLEYMTAGRYLGELGRIMLVDYMTGVLGLSQAILPPKLLKRFDPRNTTFLSHYRPDEKCSLVDLLHEEFPAGNDNTPFQWSEEMAHALYKIAKAIETRAAGIVAAATVGLLQSAGELPLPDAARSLPQVAQDDLELVVGYTGGCITNFQDYLADCQGFLDTIIQGEYGENASTRVVLSPCHDGGIKGAGILVPASLASQGV